MELAVGVFSRPDETVFELIVRRRLPQRLGEQAFGPQALFGVSEVGLTVSDVPVAAARLERAFGLKVVGGLVSATFGAVGDDDGLLVLVLVRFGRMWSPTRGAGVHPAEVHVQIGGVRAGSARVNGLATVIRGKPVDRW